MPRRFLPPYPDGSVKREYRCHRAKDARDPGCGRNHIDGLRADQAVAAAIVARLGDPRRAEHVGKVREQRTIIEAQISQWEQHADDLVTKTPTWGVTRVDGRWSGARSRDRRSSWAASGATTAPTGSAGTDPPPPTLTPTLMLTSRPEQQTDGLLPGGSS
ncbi:MAG: hypothetical protein ACRDRK_25580 [Pseudonocardia sp.]